MSKWIWYPYYSHVSQWFVSNFITLIPSLVGSLTLGCVCYPSNYFVIPCVKSIITSAESVENDQCLYAILSFACHLENKGWTVFFCLWILWSMTSGQVCLVCCHYVSNWMVMVKGSAEHCNGSRRLHWELQCINSCFWRIWSTCWISICNDPFRGMFNNFDIFIWEMETGLFMSLCNDETWESVTLKKNDWGKWLSISVIVTKSDWRLSNTDAQLAT